MLLDNNFFYSFLLVGVSLKKNLKKVGPTLFFDSFVFTPDLVLQPFFFSEELLFHSLLHCWPVLFVLYCQVSYYVEFFNIYFLLIVSRSDSGCV